MRTATVNRTTGETDIRLQLELDGTGASQIDTGVGFLNHMLTLLAKHGLEQDTSIRRYTDYKEMVETEKPTLVGIATESGIHAEIALYCIAHSVNVIIEKPMAMSMADADAIVEAAQRNHVKVCACHQNRFNPAVQATRKALEEGRFGKLSHGSIHVRWNRNKGYYDQAPWRGTWAMDGGGALMNQGIHGIDVFRYLLGPVKTINGLARTLTREKNGQKLEVEDAAAAVLEFENGALGIIGPLRMDYAATIPRLEYFAKAVGRLLSDMFNEK